MRKGSKIEKMEPNKQEMFLLSHPFSKTKHNQTPTQTKKKKGTQERGRRKRMKGNNFTAMMMIAVMIVMMMMMMMMAEVEGQQLSYKGRNLNYDTKITTFTWVISPAASTTISKVFFEIPPTYHVILSSTSTTTMEWVSNNGPKHNMSGLMISCNINSADTEVSVSLYSAYKEVPMVYGLTTAETTTTVWGETTGPWSQPQTAQDVTAPSTITISVTIRDFSIKQDCGLSDFECFGGSGAKGMVRTTLGDDGIPVMINPNPSHLHGNSSFYQWYRDIDGQNGKSYRFEVPIVFDKIFDNPPEYKHNDQNFFPLVCPFSFFLSCHFFICFIIIIIFLNSIIFKFVLFL